MSNYDLSKKSLKSFLLAKDSKVNFVGFESVTESFLNEYEKWMIKKGKSITTVGIYLRPLRAVFNAAIEQGELAPEYYPFGKRKYQIPAGRNIKKALKKEDLKKLMEQEVPKKSLMEKARDFWFFSFACSGMNTKDIAELKWKNINNDTLSFIRSKTINTNKHNQKPIIVPLIQFAKEVIEKYGNSNHNKDEYIFSILNAKMNAERKDKAVKAFTRFINQHIKKLAKLAGVTEQISFTMHAIFYFNCCS